MINFHFEDIKPFIVRQKFVREVLRLLIQNEEKIQGDIQVIFCSDDYLLQMNINFLKHDYYTDIITFDYGENDVISGELYISTDRIRENATTFGTGFKCELMRVMMHGVLHLLGYGDKTKTQKKIMRDKEEYYLSKFDIEKVY